MEIGFIINGINVLTFRGLGEYKLALKDEMEI
jgi:hypothetical protein